MGDQHQVHRLQQDRFPDLSPVEKDTVRAVVINDRPPVLRMEKGGMLSGNSLSPQCDLLVSAYIQRHHFISQGDPLPLYTLREGSCHQHHDIMTRICIIDGMDSKNTPVIYRDRNMHFCFFAIYEGAVCTLQVLIRQYAFRETEHPVSAGNDRRIDLKIRRKIPVLPSHDQLNILSQVIFQRIAIINDKEPGSAGKCCIQFCIPAGICPVSHRFLTL